ncbi:MAG: hypothetical protein R2813_13395 [Flavobacteriales bacterium]
MEAVHTHSEEKIEVNLKATTPSWIAKLDEAAEFNRYAIISIGFLLVGIVGGSVVGFFAHDATWKIATIVGFSMMSLTLMLAVAPMKYVTRSILAAMLVDLLMILISVI